MYRFLCNLRGRMAATAAAILPRESSERVRATPRGFHLLLGHGARRRRMPLSGLGPRGARPWSRILAHQPRCERRGLASGSRRRNSTTSTSTSTSSISAPLPPSSSTSSSSSSLLSSNGEKINHSADYRNDDDGGNNTIASPASKRKRRGKRGQKGGKRKVAPRKSAPFTELALMDLANAASRLAINSRSPGAGGQTAPRCVCLHEGGGLGPGRAAYRLATSLCSNGGGFGSPCRCFGAQDGGGGGDDGIERVGPFRGTASTDLLQIVDALVLEEVWGTRKEMEAFARTILGEVEAGDVGGGEISHTKHNRTKPSRINEEDTNPLSWLSSLEVAAEGDERVLARLTGVGEGLATGIQRAEGLSQLAAVLAPTTTDIPEGSLPRRIEAVDISHTHGYGAVAAVSVVVDGRPLTEEYMARDVTAPGVGPGHSDDCAAIAEAVRARFSGDGGGDGHSGEGRTGRGGRNDILPDVLLVDGGRGQLAAAERELERLGMGEKVPVIALAKRLETVHLSSRLRSNRGEESGGASSGGREDAEHPLHFLSDPDSPLLLLLRLARDEAHAAALLAHRLRRAASAFAPSDAKADAPLPLHELDIGAYDSATQALGFVTGRTGAGMSGKEGEVGEEVQREEDAVEELLLEEAGPQPIRGMMMNRRPAPRSAEGAARSSARRWWAERKLRTRRPVRELVEELRVVAKSCRWRNGSGRGVEARGVEEGKGRGKKRRQHTNRHQQLLVKKQQQQQAVAAGEGDEAEAVSAGAAAPPANASLRRPRLLAQALDAIDKASNLAATKAWLRELEGLSTGDNEAVATADEKLGEESLRDDAREWGEKKEGLKLKHEEEKGRDSGAGSFRIASPYNVTGEQQKVIDEIAGRILMRDKPHSVLKGATGTGKTFVMSKIVEQVKRPTLVLAPNKVLAAQLYDEFRRFFPDNAVEYFVSYYDYYRPESYKEVGDLFFDKVSVVNEDIDRLRHRATRALLTRRDVIVVASVSCIYGLGMPKAYIDMAFRIDVVGNMKRKKAKVEKEKEKVDGAKKTGRRECGVEAPATGAAALIHRLSSLAYTRSESFGDMARGRFYCDEGGEGKGLSRVWFWPPYDEGPTLVHLRPVASEVSDSSSSPSASVAAKSIHVIDGDAWREGVRRGFGADEFAVAVSQRTKEEGRGSIDSNGEEGGGAVVEAMRVEVGDAVTVFPASHHVMGEGEKERVIHAIEDELELRLSELEAAGKRLEHRRLKERTQKCVEDIAAQGFCKGIENFSRHLAGRPAGSPPECLLDYFPSRSFDEGEQDDDSRSDRKWLLMVDESHVTIPQIRSMYEGDRRRKATLVKHGFRLPSALDNRPLTSPEFWARVPQAVYVSATPGNEELRRVGAGSALPAETKLWEGKDEIVEMVLRPTGICDPLIEVRGLDGYVDDLVEEIKLASGRGERVLITAVTKRLAEGLAEYLWENGIKSAWLHSGVKPMERLKILGALRSGAVDVIVGVNLLREGLDLPEVALVIICDADKEGFLRCDTSLIQTIGRAARHINGRVIMYADVVTGSMHRAIEETQRRRGIQLEYNEMNNITPTPLERNRSRNALLEIMGSARREGNDDNEADNEKKACDQTQ